MILTKQQEEEYIKKYERVIWLAVHRFKNRASRQSNEFDNMDDLFQESAIVFLNHVRKCETEEEIAKRIPFRDMINAMSRFIVGHRVLSYPKRTTHYRAKGTEEMAYAVSYTDVDLDDRYLEMTIDNVVENMTMKSFLDSLGENERKIADYKSRGLKNREIAKILGVTDVYITRTLAKMREKYKSYVS